MNFDKSTVRLHYFHIFFMLTKFQRDQRLIAMSLINCLNSSFRNLKWRIKNEFYDHMVNYTRLTWKLACMLRTYRKCNWTVGFSKYEFNNKLLVSVTFFRVTSSVTWSQPYIFQFNVNFDKFTVRLHYFHIFVMITKFQGNQRLIVMSSINYLNSSFCSLK